NQPSNAADASCKTPSRSSTSRTGPVSHLHPAGAWRAADAYAWDPPMPESRHATSAPDAAAGERRTLTLSLTGMTTLACARRIERSLGRLEGVESHVDYGGARATASFEPERIALTDLLDAVRAAGYGAVPVEQPLAAASAPSE